MSAGYFFSLLFAACIFYIIASVIYGLYIKPIVKISPPADKILKLVKAEEGFEIYDGAYDCPLGIKETSVDYTLKDLVTGDLTYLSRFYFYGAVNQVKGSLRWMTEYEGETLYNIVSSIIGKRREEEKKAADQREKNILAVLREEAKKVYQDR